MRILLTRHPRKSSLLVRGTGSRFPLKNDILPSHGFIDSPPNDAVLNLSRTNSNWLEANASSKVSVCRGDSGGPAISIELEGLPILVGVFSGFVGQDLFYCPAPRKKMFWARLYGKRRWIESVMKKDFGPAFKCGSSVYIPDSEEKISYLYCWKEAKRSKGMVR